MSYILRDSAGVMFAEVSNAVAEKIINHCPGFFRKRKVQDLKEQTCYEITESTVYGLPEFKIFLWQGTVLIPKVDK